MAVTRQVPSSVVLLLFTTLSYAKASSWSPSYAGLNATVKLFGCDWAPAKNVSMNLWAYHNLLYSGVDTDVFDRYAADQDERLPVGRVLRDNKLPPANSEAPPTVKVQWLLDPTELLKPDEDEERLESETFLIGGVLWHLSIRADTVPKDLQFNQGAVSVELQATLAPTRWRATERVTVSGKWLAPYLTPPTKKGAKWLEQDATGRGQAFELVLSAERPAARLALISSKQLARFMRAGEMHLSFNISNVSATWVSEPTHIEAAYGSAAECHASTYALAMNAGVQYAMAGVWPAIVHDPGTREVGLRYSRSNLAVDSSTEMIFSLVLDNLLCHFRGDYQKVTDWLYSQQLSTAAGIVVGDAAPSHGQQPTSWGPDASQLTTPCPGWSSGSLIVANSSKDWLTPAPPPEFAPNPELASASASASASACDLNDVGCNARVAASDSVEGVQHQVHPCETSSCEPPQGSENPPGTKGPEGKGKGKERQAEEVARGRPVESGPGAPGVTATKGHPEVPDFITERGTCNASGPGNGMFPGRAAAAAAEAGADGKQQKKAEDTSEGVVDLALSVIRAVFAWGILMAVGFAAAMPGLLLLQARSAPASTSSCGGGADAAAEEAPSDGAGFEAEPQAAETQATEMPAAAAGPELEAEAVFAAEVFQAAAAAVTVVGFESQAASASPVEAVEVEVARPVAAAAPGATSTSAKGGSRSRARRKASAANRASTATPVASGQAPATATASGQAPAARGPATPAGPDRRAAGRSGRSNHGAAAAPPNPAAAGASAAAAAAVIVGSDAAASSSSTNSSVPDIPALESTAVSGPAVAAATATATSVPPARIDPQPVTIASFIAAAATATVAALGRMVMLGRAVDRAAAAVAVTATNGAVPPALVPDGAARDQVQEQEQQQQQSGDQQEEAPPVRLSLRQRLALLSVGSSPKRAGRAEAAGNATTSASPSTSEAVATAATTVVAAAPSGPDPHDSDSRLCLVCLDEPRQVGFLHGGSVHFGVCGGCAELMRQRPDVLCPVCRGPVERLVEIFG